MEFIEKNETNERFYSVNCDKKKLKDILKKLKNYSYTAMCHYKISGERLRLFKWPVTEKNIKKRVTAFFNATKKNTDAILYPETIIHHTEDYCDYVTFDYSYTKLPDLYYYIGYIVNDNDNFIDYEQIGLDNILKYINSPELTNHDSINGEKEYDYEGLNKLYKETLACFSFNLIAIKEYLKEPEQEDVLKLLLKK